MIRIQSFILLLLLILVPGKWASAQWTTQNVELKAGWNAVFLEVDPYPPQCDLALEGMPVESVWWLDQHFSSVQFIQDPDSLAADNPQWRCFFPAERAESFANNLYIFQANQAYMIKASTDAVWSVKGQPVWQQQEWNPENYNLVGFHVDAANPPTLFDWFSPSAAHSPLEIWAFGQDQVWHPVSNPRTTYIQSGQAYWVFAHGASNYQGPVQIELPAGTNLDYPEVIAELAFNVDHLGGKDRSVMMNYVNSEQPPAENPDVPGGEITARLGEVPLAYYSFGIDDASYDYRPLPVTVPFAATEELPKQLRLAVERKNMPAVTGEGNFQSILAISDGAGFRRLLGVSSDGRSSSTAAKMSSGKGLLQSIPLEVGLWIGTVTLNKVSEPNVLNASPAPILMTDTASEFNFRLILHVDEQGVVRLLNEVTQMFRRGETMADPYNPDEEIVLEPARMVLVTSNPPQEILDEIAEEKIIASILRDGRPFANRISSAMFSLHDADGEPEVPELALTGSFYDEGSTLQGTIVLEDSDPLNPFHHRYHPMHAYPEEGSTPISTLDYTITRNLLLTFSEESPEGLTYAGWGDTQVGGTYRESMTGLRKVDQTTPPVVTQGYFLLDRISNVPVLNDGH